MRVDSSSIVVTLPRSKRSVLIMQYLGKWAAAVVESGEVIVIGTLEECMDVAFKMVEEDKDEGCRP